MINKTYKRIQKIGQGNFGDVILAERIIDKKVKKKKYF